MDVKKGYQILVASFFISFIFILTSPVFQHLGFEEIAQINYLVYKPYCHQLDGRSFHLFGFKLSVCARCSGIYLGFLLGALAYPAFRKIEDTRFPDVKYLILGVFPLVLDGVTQLIGLRESNNNLRLFTGILFGITLSIYMVVAVSRIIQKLGKR